MKNHNRLDWVRMSKWRWLYGTVFLIILPFFFLQDIFAQEPPPIERGIRNKTKGQVIFLATNAQVAAWCDFEKSIILTAQGILCVYNGSVPTR